jgi:hypothetical protein
MAVLNIEKSFLTENRSVYDFLNQSGQGLYIPLYQREYSWDSDNIEQLLEDLARGIQRIVLGEVNDDTKEIRFLGTIITVVESNRNNIYPVDIQAVPSRIEKLIDGQQRVSTIALMATLLVKRLIEIKNKIKNFNPIYEQVNEICDAWINQKLSPLFSFDLGRGTPRLKPKIIRGAKDYWTRDKDVEEAYHSELSNYLGHFIKAYVDKTSFPCLSKDKYGDSLLYKNGRRIEMWLKKTVATAHEEQSDEFASAINILQHFQQEQLWDYDRQELVSIVNENNITDKKSNSYILCELVQTLSVCHYLLDRCCFTIIQPTDDDWAFDMFQSLNATGTPLTAIETFKPTVVNTIDSEDGLQFKESLSDLYFKKIENFLSEGNTAPQKNKRTNDYLTSFFVAYDGRTMSTHFSYQRKALNDVYSGLATIDEKESFIKKMGNYAEFYKEWIDYDGKNNATFPLINNAVDTNLASMLILFLKASNHKMAITMFASMYNSLRERHSQDNVGMLTEEDTRAFTEIIKLIAGYYFLWRSAFSNAGLDTTYRDFFKNNEFSVDAVRHHIKGTLQKKGIGDSESWKLKAKQYLKYDSTGRDIIKLALMIAAHDTIISNDDKALLKIGRDGCSPYLNISKWLSPSLKTIEHIAPQTNQNEQWDKDLYDPNIKTYQSLGNLTLLPQDINSSVGNKGWKEKLLYYQTVGEKDIQKVQAIKEHASNWKIELNDSTVNILKDSEFNQHLESISSMTTDDAWNREVVDKRTDAMLNIIWERVSKWVF